MAAPSISQVPIETRELDPARFRMHGIAAGFVGAALLAAWFLVLDTLRGHPLFTPTLLAHALLTSGETGTTPDALPGELRLTLVFTAVHALAFAVIGFTVAEFLRRFDLIHSKALTLVLLFGALCVTFLTFGVIFTAVGPNAILLRDAFAGNAIAAFGMAGYLWRALHAPERD
jgi:hypothetical protein